MLQRLARLSPPSPSPPSHRAGEAQRTAGVITRRQKGGKHVVLWSKPPRSLRGSQGGSLKVGEWRMDSDPGGGSAAARGLAREPPDLGRRRVVQQPALDPGAVVCVTVRRDHGHAHQRARDRARELVAELLSREQRHGGHGAVPRRRARVLRHAPPAPVRHPLENGAVNWPQRRETRPPRDDTIVHRVSRKTKRVTQREGERSRSSIIL